MLKGIKKNIHGLADYVYIPLVLAAPRLADFEENKQAALACRLFAATDLGYSLLTKAKWGVVKLIPYKTHAAMDVASGIAAFAVPYLLRGPVQKRVRNTFFLMGVTGILVGALSLLGSGKK